MYRANWTRDELVIAFGLYCKIPFGRIHIRNPQIIELAKVLGRTPSAVSWKLANLASLDPSLQKRNIAGAAHGAKLDKEVWDEFSGNWNKLTFESERLLAEAAGIPVKEAAETTFPEGGMRAATVMVRVNQAFFRSAILAAYDGRCCITGLAVPALLNASHIIPWKDDAKNRTNPCNGLCLNAIHDRAFDFGLLTVTPEHRVRISRRLLRDKDPAVKALFSRYDGRKITLPSRFQPDPQFLDYHNRHVFAAE